MFKYDYPRPALTVDVVLLIPVEWNLALCKMVLIERGNDPYKGQWALPGGFVNENESCEEAVIRETIEETGIDIGGLPLYNIGIFSKPGRDPRGWTVASAYTCIVRDVKLQDKIIKGIVAGDDATTVKLFNIGYPYGSFLPKLAFDHQDIVSKAFTLLELGK